ncbi:SDR family oxidoreductase [Longimicrobium sp.]|uniref:SDR family oxidoreductase n=1 Tax=Longimicrobium sp. TaxID=2029185 RepID=UPI002BBCC7CB|nr:SDR family oxidoreductase [Longimicrobium sp.]HSU16309.1 SDR family oxidoreductase [Longimicrobium sp.]
MKTALVTGGNRGIGLEVCRQLARRGYRVVLGARDVDRGEAAARALAGEGEIVARRVDVTDFASLPGVAAEMEREFGGVDVLVNNAGVLLDEEMPVLELPIETAKATFETNVFGALAACQAFVPGMMRRRWGRVVNVSSGASLLAYMQGYAPSYSMSKTALNAVTRQVAHAARGRNVLVNSVDPGWVRTDMGGSSAPRSVEKGAETIIQLATLDDGGPTGGFFKDGQQIPW